MPLDTLEADLAAVFGVDGVTRRCADIYGGKFELMVKVLQRDDPLRRSYLQRRWHGVSTPLSLEKVHPAFEPTLLSPIAPDRG
jgi:hypothetical protein